MCYAEFGQGNFNLPAVKLRARSEAAPCWASRSASRSAGFWAADFCWPITLLTSFGLSALDRFISTGTLAFPCSNLESISGSKFPVNHEESYTPRLL